MSKEIGILQIGDLLIDSEKTADNIIASLKDFPGRLPRIDYAVICGNITAFGTPKEMEAAKRALHQMRQLLFPDAAPLQRRALWYNRILIVPGNTDAPIIGGIRSYTAFEKLYQEFYKDPIAEGRIEPFAPDRAIARWLLDVSLIGVCYFSDVTDADEEIGRVLGVLESARPEFVSRKFAIETPTILVSSYPSLLPLDGAARIRQRALHPGRDLPIDLHLIGGPVTCILPEPYHCEYSSIGLGPRLPDQPWSGRINVITIRQADWGTRPESEQEIRRNVRVTAYRRSSSALARWDPSTELIDLGRMLPNNTGDGFIFQPIFEQLEKMLDRANVAIRVTGLPGAGKKEIYLQLQQHAGDLFRTPRLLECNVLMVYKFWQKILEDVLQKMSSVRSGQKPVIVINDQAARRAGQNRFQEIADIEQQLMNLAQQSQYRFIYLFDYMTRPPKLPEGFEEYRLEPLAADLMEKLGERYLSRLPVKEEHLSSLTSGYLGFTLPLLQAIKSIIEQEWPGSRSIEEDTSWMLISEALKKSKDLKEITDRFTEVIVEEAGGAQIKNYIQTIIQERIKKYGITERLMDPIAFTISELQNRLDSRKAMSINNDIEHAANTFTEARLLEVDENGRYRLRELIPFLVVALTAQDPALTFKTDSPAPGTFVFISYSSQDRDRVQTVIDGLAAENIPVWWDQDLLPGDEWNRNIANALKSSGCVLVMLSNRALKHTPWVAAEADRSGDKVIVATLAENLEVPLPFNVKVSAALEGWDGNRRSEVWQRLVAGIRKKLMQVPQAV